MRILLVDDSPTMRSIEKNALGAIGDAEFVEAADGLFSGALKAGGNDYVIKPFRPETLLERVKLVLNKLKNDA